MSLLTLSFTLSFVSGDIGITLAITSVCANVGFFLVGLGSICWVVSSEIFPLKLRAQASTLGALSSRLSSGLVTMTFLSVCNLITIWGDVFMFALFPCGAIAFVHGCVSEMRGKSLEQIGVLFENETKWSWEAELSGDLERLS
ncbi:Probable polyol transporter 4 [Linum perenne]